MTMKRCSKFLAWLLTLIMVFSMMPVVVFADEGEATTQGPSLVVPGDELGIAGKQGALVVHLDQRKNNIFVAMTATKHSTNGRLVAKKVSVTDGKILFREESEAEAISIWTITCENGAYYLQSGGQYLDLSSGAKMTSKPYPVKIMRVQGKLRLMEKDGKTSVNLKSHDTDQGFQASTWTTSQGNAVEVNELFDIIPVEINSNVNVSFNMNGAPNTIDSLVMNIGDEITLPHYEGDYIGHELVGWKCSLDNKTYSIGEKITLPDAVIVIFTAVWKEQKIVTFDANGGNLEAPAAITIKDGVSTVTLPNYEGTREGYKFFGWSTTSEEYATVNKLPKDIYRPGEEYPVQTTNNKLYAMWSYLGEVEVQFGIRKDGNIPKEPGDFSKSDYTKHVITNQRVAEQRWVVDTSANGRIEGNHLVNDVTRNLSYLPTNEELKVIYPSFDPDTQYVHWYVMKWPEKNGYVHIDGVVLDRSMNAITYDNNTLEKVSVPLGYQVETGSTIVVGAEKGNTAASDPIRNGYNFVGWNTQADGQGTSYNTGDRITVNSPMTLYAIWSKGVLKVTVRNTDEKENILTDASFELKKGATKVTTLSSNGACDTLENDTVYSLEETAAPAGHTKLSERFYFKVAADAEGKLAMQICDAAGMTVETPDWLTVSDATVSNGITQITITVEDELNKYQVAYDVEQAPDDITTPAPEFYEKDGIVTLADAPDLDDYIFSGWMINGQKVSGSTFEMPEEDVTIEGIYYGPIEVEIESDWNPNQMGYKGALITLTAITDGPDNLDYTYQWQYQSNGSWTAVDGETGVTLTYELDAETSGRIWRVIITDATPKQE